MTYTVDEAKDKLPELLKAVESGEAVPITCDGRPVVDMVPAAQRLLRLGTMKDLKIVLDPDWARPQNDLDAWLAGDV